ncbi:glycosyltransferase family 2 protein [Luteimonas sp. A482]
MTEVTAIVLNFRTPEKTLECLRSLAQETIRHVVLVENSEDGGVSLSTMRPGIEGLKGEGVGIDIVDEGRNLGFAAGVNRALGLIRDRQGGDVLLLNSDARLEPGALCGLREALRAGADAAAPLVVSSTAGLSMPVSHYHRCLGILTKDRLRGSFPYITGACVLFAPGVARDGLFDEDFFFYGEDVMLGARMEREGKVCAVVSESRIVHEGAGSARNGSVFYEYHINRGHWLLALKLPTGRISLFLYLAGRLLFLPSRATVRSIRHGSLNPLKGFCMATSDLLSGIRRTLTPPATRKPPAN